MVRSSLARPVVCAGRVSADHDRTCWDILARWRTASVQWSLEERYRWNPLQALPWQCHMYFIVRVRTAGCVAVLRHRPAQLRPHVLEFPSDLYPRNTPSTVIRIHHLRL